MIMRGLIFIGLTAIVVLNRLVEHPPEFYTGPSGRPLQALRIFRNRVASLLAPLATMMVSDVAIEAATRLHLLDGWLAYGRGFYAGMWVVYLAVAAVWAFGLLLRSNISVGTVAGSSFAGSLIFYLVTNFAWLPGHDEYPHTLAGLGLSYVLACPSSVGHLPAPRSMP